MTQNNQDNMASSEPAGAANRGRVNEPPLATKADRRRVAPKAAGKATNSTKSTVSKSDIVLKKLRTQKGATLDALIEITGWQAHSVRGFLSGTVRKKLGLPLSSDIGKDGKRRYRLAETEAAAE